MGISNQPYITSVFINIDFYKPFVLFIPLTPMSKDNPLEQAIDTDHIIVKIAINIIPVETVSFFNMIIILFCGFLNLIYFSVNY